MRFMRMMRIWGSMRIDAHVKILMRISCIQRQKRHGLLTSVNKQMSSQITTFLDWLFTLYGPVRLLSTEKVLEFALLVEVLTLGNWIQLIDIVNIIIPEWLSWHSSVMFGCTEIKQLKALTLASQAEWNFECKIVRHLLLLSIVGMVKLLMILQ